MRGPVGVCEMERRAEEGSCRGGLVGLGGILSLIPLFHGLVVSPHLTVSLMGAETTVQSVASAPSMVPGAQWVLSGCLLTLLSHWLTLSVGHISCLGPCSLPLSRSWGRCPGASSSCSGCR